MPSGFNLTPVIPEIFVALMACLILVVDLYVSKRRETVAYGLSLITLVGAAVLTIRDFSDVPVHVFGRMFVDDTMSDLIKVAIYLTTFGVFVYSRDYVRARGIFRAEYFVLGLFGVVGMMIMASANHFLTLYLGLELLSLNLYAMVAFQRDSPLATEAAMKYFVLGALASGMMLYGMSMLYGLTGDLEIGAVRSGVAQIPQTNVALIFGLVFIIVSLGFKLGAVPFHMWVPDVYHGAPTTSTAYISSAPKLAGFAIVMRLLVGGLEDVHAVWQDMIIILAVLSIAIGNVVAIAQTNLKRMFAYSTISHMGFFLLGILCGTPNGYSSAMFYVLVYSVMSLGGFGMIILLSRAGFEAEELDDYKGLNKKRPWYAFLMLLLMFSMAGVPPTVGFYAKFSVIQALLDVGLVGLAVVAVVFAVVGAYYYLRVVRLMYFDEPTEDDPIEAPLDMRLLIGLNGLSMLLVMPWVGVLFDLCNAAVGSLVF
ncbi:MAG: NADH-quinone oxidoreductase subunit NuoN [Gammaproteobacteria bacterium]|nr:NADH-quinone oxidoreductase subunit NuoN [Gammaproteobacteria bacterium]